MRHSTLMVLASIIFLCGCTYERKAVESARAPQGASPASPSRATFVPPKSQSEVATKVLVSMADRKVIRNAELTIEVDVPTESKRRIEALAESYGGFVVTSEAIERGAEETDTRSVVKVVVRIPAAKFAAALDEIRKVGRRIRYEKITGQDVTEEYFDLEARLKAKKALESQFLEIMKQAKQVSEALEVQRALADVRGEIEQMEGRRRYLENQANLSTVTVTLETPAPLVSSSVSGFFQSVRRAFGEGFDGALEVIFWLIRLALVLIPIVIFIVLPVIYLWRRIRRRRSLRLQAQAAGK